MHASRRFLAPLFLASLLTACAAPTPPPPGEPQAQKPTEKPVVIARMSNSCEVLHKRFEDGTTGNTLCSSFNPSQPTERLIGGAVLKNVKQSSSSYKDGSAALNRYELTFQSRSKLWSVTTYSAKDVNLETGEFYAIDLMNDCRTDALRKDDTPSAALLKSFSLPSKLACL